MIEVLFYLGIVRQYQFYGDEAIYANLYHTVSKDINRNPVTENGKRLNKLLETTIDKIMKRTGDVEAVRKFFLSNKDKFGGLDEGFVVSYAKSKISDIADSINLNVLDQIGKNIYLLTPMYP